MNHFNEFKKYMDKIGVVCTREEENGLCRNFQLGKYLHFQISSREEQDENLIATHICLRKPGQFYFPLGEAYSYSALGLIEKIEEILLEYGINHSLLIKACW
jgi:hypothetical protein